MRIGLIAPPFIEVPPRAYGGTELFIANLARELHGRGHDVTVYANGDSQLPCPVKWRYPHAEWPLTDALRGQLKNADHSAWAIAGLATGDDGASSMRSNISWKTKLTGRRWAVKPSKTPA